MINQQINLYQDRFREKRLWISAIQVVVALGVLVVGLSVWSYLLEAKFDQLEQRNAAIKAERDQATAELAVANAELAVLLEDRTLDLQIESTAQQVNARKRVLKFVEANQFGSGEGFSDYLLALTRVQAGNVWLNRVRFAEDLVEISGSALDAAEVPIYFEGFSEESVFQGKRFDMFQLTRPVNNDWKIDFRIATRVGDDG